MLSALACLGDKPRGQAEGREEIWLQVACRLQKVPHVKDLNLILRFRESLKYCEMGDGRDKRVAEVDLVSGSTPHFVNSESSLNALKVYTVRSKLTSPPHM